MDNLKIQYVFINTYTRILMYTREPFKTKTQNSTIKQQINSSHRVLWSGSTSQRNKNNRKTFSINVATIITQRTNVTKRHLPKVCRKSVSAKKIQKKLLHQKQSTHGFISIPLSLKETMYYN